MKTFNCLFITLFFINMLAYSQTHASLLQKRIDHVKNIYDQHIQSDTRSIVNGKHYERKNTASNSSPYFISDNWTKGSVVFDGEAYENLLLKYDLEQDILVYYHVSASGGIQIALNKQKVETFQLHRRHFIHINNLSETTTMEEGYYEVLVNGYASFYIKRAKELEQDINYQYDYEVKKKRYIKINDTYHLIRGRRDILNVFSDKKKKVRKYIREQGIAVRYAGDPTIEMVVNYYNQLHNTENE